MASSQDEVPEQVVYKSEQVPEQVSEQEPAQVPDKAPKSEKITKPKNPGRVAAGKRLAEMNRKNKAMKNPPTEHHLAEHSGDLIAIRLNPCRAVENTVNVWDFFYGLVLYKSPNYGKLGDYAPL